MRTRTCSSHFALSARDAVDSANSHNSTTNKLRSSSNGHQVTMIYSRKIFYHRYIFKKNNGWQFFFFYFFSLCDGRMDHACWHELDLQGTGFLMPFKPKSIRTKKYMHIVYKVMVGRNRIYTHISGGKIVLNCWGNIASFIQIWSKRLLKFFENFEWM